MFNIRKSWSEYEESNPESLDISQLQRTTSPYSEMVSHVRLERTTLALKVRYSTNWVNDWKEWEEVAHLPPIKRTRQGTPILESGRNSVSIGVDAFSYLSPPTHYATSAPPACMQAGRELNPNSFWLGCTLLPVGDKPKCFFNANCRQHIRHLVEIVGFEPTMFLVWRILSALCLANCIISPSGILFSFLTLGTYLVYHKFS